MTPIKICFVITRLIKGGAQKVVLDVIRGLDRSEYDVTLVFGSFGQSEGTLLPEAEALGIRLVSMPALQRAVSPWRDPIALWKLYRLFRRERFDLVHTHTSKAGFVGTLAARAARVPAIVYSPHGHIFYETAQIRGVSESRLKLAFFYRLRKLSERFADKVVALTHADMAEQVALGLAPAVKYAVIPNGIDMSRFARLDAVCRRRTRDALGLQPGAFVVGTVARLSGEKGQRHLIEAMTHVKSRRPSAKLLLVGDGPSRAELEALVAERGLAGDVIFAGVRDDVPELLSAMDVFVLPSLYEAQGIAIVEAMAASRPVVATRVGGVPGIVEHERDGLLVPACDSEAIARAVVRLADDAALAKRLGRAAHDRAHAELTVASMVGGHDRLFKRLAGLPVCEPSKTRMVVLSSASHFHAPIVLREMCRQLPDHDITLVLTPKVGKGGLRKVVEQSGWDFLLSMIAAKARFEFLRLVERLCRVQFERRQFLSMGEVARRCGLRPVRFAWASGAKAREFIGQVRPHFIVLNLFNQIVRAGLIELASEECLNLHTSYLPEYRGVAPCFWALANGDRVGGTAVHRVTPGIDDGDVLARERVTIDPDDSFFSFYRRCAVIAGRMLIDALKDSDRASKAIDQSAEASTYFTFADRDAVTRLRRRKKSFFSFACLRQSARLLRDPKEFASP